MIDHIGIHPSSMETSRRFYGAALKALAIVEVMEVRPEETGGYHGIGYGAGSKPFFWLSSDSRSARQDVSGSAGLHIAFAAESRTAVDAFYAAAIAQGGRDNGPPGLRPHYHPAYYAAFVLDPDGVNVEAVCHKPD
ncbi:VOC family protein [Bosea sp. (in: a-proteobacteria)]|uniref:VOC family protein n=1 Tax=Bosea sp. (in: a-proteobacteria) TaxID=1871050 RepID=UPI00120EF7BF|nr:VOC family protein [Bosea sp. (in: a-proteobacteria)]TAJ31232.1 MAG: VOC family protein [Bosea sp. (in: a-proteobacteria)]